MRPSVQTVVFQVRKDRVILFGQRGGKVPGRHHADVILLRMHRRHHLRIGGIKPVIQKVIHQHADGKPDGIGFPRREPCLHRTQQFRRMLPEDLRGHLVAGCPVVHIRQKTADSIEARGIVLHIRKNERMQLIFLKPVMRQFLNQHLCAAIRLQFFRQFPEVRCPHADHRLRLHGWDQFHLKISVCLILHTQQSFPDFLKRHAPVPLPVFRC